MANSKRKCASCKQYRLREELTVFGLSSICADNPECRKSQVTKAKKTCEKKVATKKKKANGHGLSQELRQEIRRRDGNVCRFCGQSAYRMEVHHIRYRSQGGEDANWNLILLCDEHHQLVHTSKRKWQPILRALIWAYYVENRGYSIPRMEKRLKREKLLQEFSDGLPEAAE